MQPNNTQNIPPQQSAHPIVGKMYRLYKYSIAFVIFAATFFSLLSLAVIPLAIMFIAILVILVWSAAKIPSVTTLSGSILTTKSFRKSRTVDLSQLSAINTRWNLITSGARFLIMRRYVLELTDNQNNKAFIDLGTIPNNERQQLLNGIIPYIEKSGKASEKVTNLLDYWRRGARQQFSNIGTQAQVAPSATALQNVTMPNYILPTAKPIALPTYLMNIRNSRYPKLTATLIAILIFLLFFGFMLIFIKFQIYHPNPGGVTRTISWKNDFILSAVATAILGLICIALLMWVKKQAKKNINK